MQSLQSLPADHEDRKTYEARRRVVSEVKTSFEKLAPLTTWQLAKWWKNGNSGKDGMEAFDQVTSGNSESGCFATEIKSLNLFQVMQAMAGNTSKSRCLLALAGCIFVSVSFPGRRDTIPAQLGSPKQPHSNMKLFITK